MEYSGETNQAEQSKLMGEGKMGYEKYYKIVVLSLPGAACREAGSGKGGHAVWITVATSGRVGSISMVTTRILHRGSVEGGSAVGPSSSCSILEHYNQHHTGSECILTPPPPKHAPLTGSQDPLKVFLPSKRPFFFSLVLVFGGNTYLHSKA